MKSTLVRTLAIAHAALALAVHQASSATVTFEDLPFPGGGNFEYPYNGSANSGFSSGGIVFNHGEFNGFAYSKSTDATTAGFTNQYSAFPGGGAGGSAVYAIGYPSATTTFPEVTSVLGLSISVANTTYAALSMRDGDSFAKKFGGASGNDPDFFLLTITGSLLGANTGSVDFYLADFRPIENSADYILDRWDVIDLSPLGSIDKIDFTLSSSDVGMFGINTPTYFALDNLLAPVPEPSSSLIAITGLGLGFRRKRLSNRAF